MQLEQITGCVLAGGQSQRMGGQDKAFAEYRGRPLIEHVVSRLNPQLGQIMINTNRDQMPYRRYFGARITAVFGDQLSDQISDQASDQGRSQGPLSGILAAMQICPTPWLLIVPCDVPNLPEDLVSRLAAALGEHDIAYAHDGKQTQHLCLLMHTRCQESLRLSLKQQKKVMHWIASQHSVAVDCSDCAESFININTTDQLNHE